MNPGDVVTCSSCGAEGRVWTSSPSTYRDGVALLVTWTNGPHPRHQSSTTPPTECTWCADRRLGFPALCERPLPSEAPWVAGGPGCTFEIPPVSLGRQPAIALARPGASPSAPTPPPAPAPGQLGLF